MEISLEYIKSKHNAMYEPSLAITKLNGETKIIIFKGKGDI